MKKILIILQLTLLQSLYADIYEDRILVYVDNSIENFDLNEDLYRTNSKELNEMMDIVGAAGINIWLPNARPTDRDGDIYLNRYYVIELGSDRSDIEKLIGRKFNIEGLNISKIDSTKNSRNNTTKKFLKKNRIKRKFKYKAIKSSNPQKKRGAKKPGKNIKK